MILMSSRPIACDGFQLHGHEKREYRGVQPVFTIESNEEQHTLWDRSDCGAWQHKRWAGFMISMEACSRWGYHCHG